MKTSTPPYRCHLFICTKNRNGEQKSCADGDNLELKPILKDAIAERGLKGKVRVCESSCFGLCETGPNIILYPQQILYSNVHKSDLPEILEAVERIVSEER